MARKLTINIHMRVCHGSVKLQNSRLGQSLQVDSSLIESTSYPRQSARASRLLRLLLFTVLLYCNILKIPLLVEGSVDGPVVRNSDGRVVDAVARELPLLQIYCAALSRSGNSRRGKRKG